MSEIEKVLSDQGVFKGFHGLEGLAESDEFWSKQMYGTRLYYGDGASDYLHRDVLRAAIRALSALFIHEGKNMHEWKEYRKKGTQSLRPYVVGEDLTGVSVSKPDLPEKGGMIAKSKSNPDDLWYVSKEFFEENYEEV